MLNVIRDAVCADTGNAQEVSEPCGRLDRLRCRIPRGNGLYLDRSRLVSPPAPSTYMCLGIPEIQLLRVQTPSCSFGASGWGGEGCWTSWMARCGRVRF